LSALDGVIGDGDHGINLSKGFRRAAEHLGDAPTDLAEALRVVADTLQDEIGGSAGPLYGTLFAAFAAELDSAGSIDRASFARALRAGVEAVRELGGAEPGDKTLLDVLVPALGALDAAAARDAPFAACLAALCDAADSGLAATRDMTARLGRAARLGERSRGTLDPGAASCALLLTTLAQGLRARLGDAGAASASATSR
jgi:dihydroxyacetone kinase phosphoprotein-dependent L subunit